MADRDLQEINSSGQLTEIKLGGAGTEKVVLTDEQVKALFGNWAFEGDNFIGATGVFVTDNNTGEASLGAEYDRIEMYVTTKFRPQAGISLPQEGDVYFDSTTKKLRCYDGTVWNDLF